MTQKAIAELYQKGVNTINEHIKDIYAEDELQESATIRKTEQFKLKGREELNAYAEVSTEVMIIMWW